MLQISKVNRLVTIGLITMAVLSFGNFTGQPVSNVVVPLGVVLFFVNRALEKNPEDSKALAFNTLTDKLTSKENILWIFIPAVVSIINVLISSNFLPQYIDYEKERAGAFVTIEMSVLSVLLFFVLALGEEIAWRAFFQSQLMKVLSPVMAIAISSILFTVGHYAVGNPPLVLYGLSFTLINGTVFGLIFYKTRNVWVSTLAHFLANMMELFLYTVLV